jgi:hypothetical protein
MAIPVSPTSSRATSMGSMPLGARAAGMAHNFWQIKDVLEQNPSCGEIFGAEPTHDESLF